MTAIAGKGGSASSAAGATGVTEWSVELTEEALETTPLGSDWRAFIEGLKGATGTFTCNDAAPATGSATLSLETGAATISGTAIVNSVGYSTPVDGVVTYTANFTFSGAVSVT